MGETGGLVRSPGLDRKLFRVVFRRAADRTADSQDARGTNLKIQYASYQIQRIQNKHTLAIMTCSLLSLQ